MTFNVEPWTRTSGPSLIGKTPRSQSSVGDEIASGRPLTVQGFFRRAIDRDVGVKAGPPE